MKITITVKKVIEDFWISEADLKSLGTKKHQKAHLLELINEDPLAFLENATWSVTIEDIT